MPANLQTFAPDLWKSLSRREFLKLSGLGLLSLLLPQQSQTTPPALEEQGRVLENGLKLLDIPSFKGNELSTFWKDTVISISEATIGDDEPAHNRVWYAVHGGGYVHSGGIQPVQTQLNEVTADIPKGGILAEVTVPFTDAHWRADKKYGVAYRLYYETTHWITGLVQDNAGRSWYRIAEDKWKLKYFAPAEHLRLIAAEELVPIAPELPPFAKRIEVRTQEQVVIAYEWNQPVYMAKTSTGAKFSNGNFATPPGRHITAHKRPSRHMAAGNLAYNGYDLPGVPWISYITESGISFHGTYWHNNFGRPRSHGCINLSTKAAKWIYLWTLPVVPPTDQYIHEDFGTSVEVM
jgi:hypothetical protein